MLATLADAPLTSPRLVYEPKYDGIRALIDVTPAAGDVRVGIWSRNGNDKTVAVSGDRRGARKRRGDGFEGRSCSTARSSPSTIAAVRPAFSGCRDACT